MVQKKDQSIQEEALKDGDKKNFYIVGIGASAGGLKPIEQFFRNLPPNPEIAFVIIQHLSPDYKSLMVELMSKYTQLEIYRAQDGMKVQKNCVYLIPPKKNMTIYQRTLFLSDQERYEPHQQLPINIFFKSLAEDLMDKAICIILSGTGSDGTLGVKNIHENGGFVIVQDPEEAKFDGMPNNAIATGIVDLVAPIKKIPKSIMKFIKNPFSKFTQPQELILHQNDYFLRILNLIRNRTGIDYHNYKEETISRRLKKRLGINQLESLRQYYNYLLQNPEEIQALSRDILIGVTRFFRDEKAFQEIEKVVIPKILEQNREEKSIRIWVVGCSTGEEAYSLAILLNEQLTIASDDYDVKIFATDIDQKSLEVASMGIYPESALNNLKETRIKSYFTKKDDHYRIKDEIRQHVIFAYQNIIKDPPFSKIDLISCRNLMIYFKTDLQKRVLSLFHFALKQRGFLFLGTSETIGNSAHLYNTIHSKWKIFQYKGGPKPNLIENLQISNKTQQSNPTRLFVSAQQKVKEKDLSFDERIQEKILEQIVSPSLLIDENLNILRFYKDVNKFLQIPSGKANLNITNLIRSELSSALNTATYKAIKEQKSVLFQNIKIENQEEDMYISLRVEPIKLNKFSQKMYFIEFQESTKAKEQSPDAAIFESSEVDNQRVKDLEHELSYTKENLQATIEELETSNEELQATNEELFASNEELQSTNEELQSVNEELYTVNSEYQNKIEELTQLTNDLDNLLVDTGFGVLFLDEALKVRKYTEFVTNILNVIESDVRRPIFHISHSMQYDEFYDDIQKVQQKNQTIERDIETKNKKYYNIKIRPYYLNEDYVEGIVVSVFEISELIRTRKNKKKLEEYTESYEKDLKIIRSQRDELLHNLDQKGVGILVLENNGQIQFYNNVAEETLGLATFKLSKHYSEYFDLINKDQEILSLINFKTKKGNHIKRTAADIDIRLKTNEEHLINGTIFHIHEQSIAEAYYLISFLDNHIPS